VEAKLSDHRSTLLVLPTGCGKTVVFAELARRYVERDQRVLVLAHRGELLEQAQAKLRSAGVTLAAIEQADRRASREHMVVIASVQTLSGQRMRKFPPWHFSLIIVDEAHHAAARSYRSILEYFSSAKLLGVTATPDRGDGKALGKIFESLAFTYEMRRAISEGFLAPLHAKRILVEKMDLSEVRTHHGDFDQTELSKLLNEDENLLGVVKPLLEQAGDRKTLVFGVDVAHARALAEIINAHKPGKAIALDGTAKPEERKAVLSLFRKGAFQYLCNCALFTEGFDEPDIACVALARPTQSRALYTQMLGRGTRLAPGKADCLVLDFVGNSGRHRLVGPADALAGRELTDEERKLVEKKLDDAQLDLEGVLESSEREAQEQKAARRRQLNDKALVLYREREVDLFLGDLMPEVDPDSPAAQRPATVQQLADIEAAKLGKPPVGISEAEAAAMLKAVKERRKLGLCSIPQARLIERWGGNTKGMLFARAGELIGMVAAVNGWSRASFILREQPEFKAGGRKP
jgi:superfamily II DNA or RNA helicase